MILSVQPHDMKYLVTGGSATFGKWVVTLISMWYLSVVQCTINFACVCCGSMPNTEWQQEVDPSNYIVSQCSLYQWLGLQCDEVFSLRKYFNWFMCLWLNNDVCESFFRISKYLNCKEGRRILCTGWKHGCFNCWNINIRICTPSCQAVIKLLIFLICRFGHLMVVLANWHFTAIKLLFLAFSLMKPVL